MKNTNHGANERLQIELYQLFREYSGVDISYNDFLPLLEEMKERADEIRGSESTVSGQ